MTTTDRLARGPSGVLALALLCLCLSACSYNRHTNMGDVEKWANSDTNIVPKVGGTIFLSLIDAIASPFTMLGDQIFRSEQYHPDHKYLSYAGSRTIGRSPMGHGYQWIASIFTIPIETVYLPITGLVDLVTVLCCGDDGTS